VLQGRAFSEQDQPHSQPVVIVNEPFVHRYFPDGNVIGKHLLVYGGTSEVGQAPKFFEQEIVGVVSGTRGSAFQTLPRRPCTCLIHKLQVSS